MSDSSTTIRGAWVKFERDRPAEAAHCFARELYLLAAVEGATVMLRGFDADAQDRVIAEVKSIIAEFAP